MRAPLERARIKMMIRMLGACAAVAVVNSQVMFAHAQSGAISFWGDYALVADTPHNNPNKPVSTGRSYFTTSVSEAPGGFKLIVDFWHGEKNTPVDLWLQVAINDGNDDGNGRVKGIPFMKLSDAVADNPDNYHSRREYLLTYESLNQALRQTLPAHLHSTLIITPGTPLFALARWPQLGSFGHTWGGLGRGGIFMTPEAPGQRASSGSAKNKGARQPVDLDLAYPISNLMAINYNVTRNGESVGLQTNGQIRSRLEAEGKYQVPLDQVDQIKKRLFDLAADPAEASRVLGPDWKLTAEMRYMKKNLLGQLLKDHQGLPVPDPMIDTYYDAMDSAGAKSDMALRYRWTEGNKTGAWNFKPGMTRVNAEGIVNRIEYGIDATDDKPESIRKFIDSMDPMNPLRVIRDMAPGRLPSEFLHPSIRVIDTRYKFKLEHRNGLVVEVSLDDALAESLRSDQRARFAQLEMDIDHLSTASLNKAKPISEFAHQNSFMSSSQMDFLYQLNKHAFIDGRAILHSVTDLHPSSPVLRKHAHDFYLAEQAIKSLRDTTVGRDWVPAPQKASLAAYMLQQVNREQASESVKRFLNRAESGGVAVEKMSQTLRWHDRLFCRKLFY